MSYQHSFLKRLNKMGCAMEFAVFFLLMLAVAVTSSRLSVRLAGSPPNTTGVNEGRIEVFDEGEWKDVCHRKWDQRDTGVVCKQLGFPGASSAMVEAYYGSGTNNKSLQSFDCTGDEATLQECKFKVADKTCRDGETAGASCFLPGYLGCYLDRTVGSVLTDASLSSDDMNVRKCLQFCYDKGMRYAGLRENTDCYCGRNGTEYDSWGKVSDTNCMLRCGGNQAEVCGGRTTWFWTSSIYDIDFARCAKPKDPSFGFVKDRGALWYGTVTTFGCYDGFRVDKEETLSCVLGEKNSELVLVGEYSTCLEIPDLSSRNKLDESNRIEAHAIFLKGTKGTHREEEASFMSKFSRRNNENKLHLFYIVVSVQKRRTSPKNSTYITCEFETTETLCLASTSSDVHTQTSTRRDMTFLNGAFSCKIRRFQTLCVASSGRDVHTQTSTRRDTTF